MKSLEKLNRKQYDKHKRQRNQYKMKEFTEKEFIEKTKKIPLNSAILSDQHCPYVWVTSLQKVR